MGEFSALLSALFYSASSLVLKPQTQRLDAITMNVVRCSVGAVFFLTCLVATGSLGTIGTIPSGAWFWLISSVVASLAAGDTFFFLSMRSIGVGRALPISAAYPLFTIIYSAALGIERITPQVALAGVLVVAGVVLIGVDRTEDAGLRRVNRLGVLFALISAALVGLSPALLGNGLVGVGVLTAGAVRLPAAVLVLLLTGASPLGRMMRQSIPPTWSRGTVIALIIGGLFGTSLSTLFLLEGIKLAGPARTSIISSCAPLLAIIPTWLWLKERLSGRTLAGTLATVAGVALAFWQ